MNIEYNQGYRKLLTVCKKQIDDGKPELASETIEALLDLPALNSNEMYVIITCDPHTMPKIFTNKQNADDERKVLSHCDVRHFYCAINLTTLEVIEWCKE